MLWISTKFTTSHWCTLQTLSFDYWKNIRPKSSISICITYLIHHVKNWYTTQWTDEMQLNHINQIIWSMKNKSYDMVIMFFVSLVFSHKELQIVCLPIYCQLKLHLNTTLKAIHIWRLGIQQITKEFYLTILLYWK